MSPTQLTISQMASALVRQGAIVGAYVPVPFLVWSVGQSMMAADGARKIYISRDMMDFLRAEVHLANPTWLFEEYLFDWWSGPAATGPVLADDLEVAYESHVTKVILNSSNNCSSSSLCSMGTKYLQMKMS